MQRAKLFAYVNNNIQITWNTSISESDVKPSYYYYYMEDDIKRILQDKQFHLQLKSE
jgi:hypothetical protein